MSRTFILLALFASYSASAAASEPNWPEIARRLDVYAKHPSVENARSATAVLPDAQVSFSGSAEESHANEIVYAEGPMVTLERQVMRREQASVDLAFRLTNIADGAFAEDLDIILGKLITIDPALFLAELQKAKGVGVESVVLNLGEAYVDEMESTCLEWQRRKKALQMVQVLALEATKLRAIAAIDEQSESCGPQ